MFPGSISKMSKSTVASAATIKAKTDVIIVTGATQIDTIVPGFGKQFCQFLVLIPTTGVTLSAAGNIAVGIAAAINRAVFLVYEPSADKWYINSGV
jgi:hypothetical protein